MFELPAVPFLRSDQRLAARRAADVHQGDRRAAQRHEGRALPRLQHRRQPGPPREDPRRREGK